MGHKSKPRAGSLAYSPRKRAKNITAKFKYVNDSSDAKILNIHGYKTGMVHVMAKNKHKGSPLNGQIQAVPATLIEVPPMRVFGVKLYTKKGLVNQPLNEFLFYDKADKEISRKIKSANRAKVKGDLLKKANDAFEKNKDKITDVRLVVHTNPKLTTIGKKKPEVIELYLGGSVEDKFSLFKEKLGKDVDASDVFEESAYIDTRAVTIGRGFQGVIKRFGVKRRSHKAEKGARKVGSISPWHPPLVMWTVPRAGQMGFHTRTQYNQKILKIVSPEEVDRTGGYEGYGAIRNKCIIVAGSIPGPVKRLVALRDTIRPVKDIKCDIESDVKVVM